MFEYLRIDSTWTIQPNGQRFPDGGREETILLLFNCPYELTEYAYYENDPFEYLDWRDPADFQRLTLAPYPQERMKRPTTFQASRKHTHYIPSLPRGNPTRIMYIPSPVPERWNRMGGTYDIEGLYMRVPNQVVPYEVTLTYCIYSSFNMFLRGSPVSEQLFTLTAPIPYLSGVVKWISTKPISLSVDPILFSILSIDGLSGPASNSEWWLLFKRRANLRRGV